MNREVYNWLYKSNQKKWQETIALIKQARTDLEPDHFRPIFHEGVDPHPPREEPQIDIPHGGSPTQPIEVTHKVLTGVQEPHSNDGRQSPTIAENGRAQALATGGGSLDKEGSISLRPLGMSVTQSGVQPEVVGGLGADNEV